MALKHKLNSTEYTALNDVLKTEYKLGTDGNYTIDLGGMFVTDKDPAGLLSALENERNDHKITKSKFDAIVAERDAAKKASELAEAQKAGDIAKIQAMFEEQKKELQKSFETQVKEERKRVEMQQKAAAEQLRTNKAMEIATALFGQSAPVMLPHVMQGINVLPGDVPQVQILQADGTPALGMDLEKYKESFLTNPLFKPYIVASKASGGSANEGTAKGVPSSTKSDGSPRVFKDYTPGELVTIKRTNPEEFRRIMATATK